MKHAKQEKQSKKWSWLVPVVLLVIVGTVSAVLLREPRDSGGLKYEQGAVNGAVGSDLSRLTEMQELVDKGMITMSINATPMYRLSDENAGVNWDIENPAAQATKLIRVEIYRDDTGEKLYETGAIPPGSYVTGTLPEVALSAGEYTCTAYFYSYDIETEEYLGQAGAQIILYVLE